MSIVGSRACSAYGGGLAADLAADLAEAGVADRLRWGVRDRRRGSPRSARRTRSDDLCPGQRGGRGLPARQRRDLRAVGCRRAAGRGTAAGDDPDAVAFPVPEPAHRRHVAGNGGGRGGPALRGARNTASWALGCHRLLMAVPGPVHSPLSEAPHLLIRNGQAVLVTSADDILELVSPAGQHTVPARSGPTRATDAFDATRMAVYEAVPARRPRQRRGDRPGRRRLDADLPGPAGRAGAGRHDRRR